MGGSLLKVFIHLEVSIKGLFSGWVVQGFLPQEVFMKGSFSVWMGLSVKGFHPPSGLC
jgi:hypothetical protein